MGRAESDGSISPVAADPTFTKESDSTRRNPATSTTASRMGTGVTYWISGPKKRGGDKLYGGVVEIDEDARIEYWTKIRGRPEAIELKETR